VDRLRGPRPRAVAGPRRATLRAARDRGATSAPAPLEPGSSSRSGGQQAFTKSIPPSHRPLARRRYPTALPLARRTRLLVVGLPRAFPKAHFCLTRSLPRCSQQGSGASRARGEKSPIIVKRIGSDGQRPSGQTRRAPARGSRQRGNKARWGLGRPGRTNRFDEAGTAPGGPWRGGERCAPVNREVARLLVNFRRSRGRFLRRSQPP